MNDPREGLTRAIAFQREHLRRGAERAVRTSHGTAYFTDDLPRAWYLNQLLVDLGARPSLDELVAETDDALGSAGLAHRRISIDDGFGAKLAPGFRGLSWLVEEDLVMPHGRAAPFIDTTAVEEVAADELAPVWSRGMRSDPNVEDEVTVRQLVEAQLRRRRAVDIRYFATRVEGRIASYCELFSDGRTAQIESVETLEEFRGRGLGKAVVAGALAASQALHDFTFIVADAHDWPQQLYRKLGFEPAGTTYIFTRRPVDG